MSRGFGGTNLASGLRSQFVTLEIDAFDSFLMFTMTKAANFLALTEMESPRRVVASGGIASLRSQWMAWVRSTTRRGL